jgi:hypothetical protein
MRFARLGDSRQTPRFEIKIPLRIRALASADTLVSAESVNLSATGLYFATESLWEVGTRVEIFLKMPEEILGRDSAEWCCKGQIVRINTIVRPGAAHEEQDKLGVGVKFHYYEVLR